MKPTQHRKTNEQKTYNDLFWAIRKMIWMIWFSQSLHVKGYFQTFSWGSAVWRILVAHMQSMFSEEFISTGKLSAIESSTSMHCVHDMSYSQFIFCILSLLTLVGYFCCWDGTEGQCALGIYIDFSIQYADIIHLVLLTEIWDTSRMLAICSLYVKGIVHSEIKVQGV